MERIRVRHEKRGLGWWVAMYDGVDAVVVYDSGDIGTARLTALKAICDGEMAPNGPDEFEEPQPMAVPYRGAL